MNKELTEVEQVLQLEISKVVHDIVNGLIHPLTAKQELYGKSKYFADQEKRELEKENKELKEKVTELEGVIAKLSQKILNKSNY